MKTQSTDEGRRISVVFRMDDYSSVSCTDLDVRIIETFRKHGMCCTFAVVPFTGWGDVSNELPTAYLPLIPEKVAILRDAIADGTIDVAQHGYCHQSVRRQPTEFAGLPLRVQEEKICRGRDLLRSALGREIRTFVPPWNSYDCETLRALDRLGFRGISAGRYGPSDSSLQISYLPVTCPLTELQQAVESAPQKTAASCIITVLFHPYDFCGHSPQRGVITLEQFDQLLDWTAAQPCVDVRSVSECLELGGLDSRALKANRPLALVPPFLGYTSARHGLFPASVADTTRRSAMASAGLVYLAYVLANVAATVLAVRMFQPSWRMQAAGTLTAAVMSTALAGYALRDRSISYRGLFALLPFLSVAVVLCVEVLSLIK